MGRKFALVYLLLTTILCVVLGTAFSGLIYRHLVRSVQDRLREEANVLVRAYEADPRDSRVLDRLRRLAAFRVVGSEMSSHVVVTDAAFRILTTDAPELFVRGNLLPIDALSLLEEGTASVTIDGSRFIMHAVPLRGDVRSAWLFLFADFGQIRAVQRDVIRLLLVSLAAAAVLAAVAGSILGARVLAPLRRLTDQVAGLSRREFYRVDVRTGDEVERLAEAINELASSLEFFERNQRELFQNISHELKTPLMSIQGYAEGIADGVFDSSETRTALMVIGREAQRVKAMVDQLIWLSRIQDPSEPYRFVTSRLDDILARSASEVGGVAMDRGVTLTVPACGVELEADPDWLERAFVNIMANAVRHAAAAVSVSIRTSDRSAAVEIHDDGPGFLDSDLPRLFARFYRGEGGQTGLGLAIARAVVDRHGGTVSAANHPKGGALVTVTLPFRP